MSRKIDQISDLLADRMIEALSSPETATPGWAQAALRMIKDNTQPGELMAVTDEKMRRLKELLPFKKTV
jgi:hypothetical protein